MSTAEILFDGLRLFFETGFLVALAAVLTALMVSSGARAAFGLARSAPLLALARGLLIVALALPAAARLAPRERLLEPQATLLSSRGPGLGARSGPDARLWLAAAAPAGSGALPSERRVPLDARALGAAAAALAAGAAWLALRRAREARRLARWIRRQPVIRRAGRVVVRATSEGGGVPASALIPGEASVLLPVELLATPALARIAIRHELQHHRQGDTRWAYAFAFLRCLFFWNPGIALWGSRVSFLQELACDEALIGRRSVTPQAYGRCLLRAAELAVGPPAAPSGVAVGMAVGSSGLLLRRRIEMLLTKREQGWKPAETAVLAVAALAATSLLGGAAYAARSAIQDRTITLSELQAKVGATDPSSEIPLTINDMVLRELNRFVGTEDGRDEIHRAFARMPQYKGMIERKLQEFGLPKDLEIVPVIESGYTNYFNPHHNTGAGLWGFIPQTARRYDMRVDELGVPGRVDDRLVEERETIAAAKYFRDLHTLFQDWRLALKGYNEGETKVMREIMDSGTRDPWELERQSESKERYLARITAVLLIYKNPALLD
jgi:hypothetical protein